jgi:hypothetical protein
MAFCEVIAKDKCEKKVKKANRKHREIWQTISRTSIWSDPNSSAHESYLDASGKGRASGITINIFALFR